MTASYRTFAFLILLCATATVVLCEEAHTSQGGPHHDQGISRQVKRELIQDEEELVPGDQELNQDHGRIEDDEELNMEDPELNQDDQGAINDYQEQILEDPELNKEDQELVQEDQELSLEEQEPNQENQDDEDIKNVGYMKWTTCNLAVNTKFSCQDCNTRLICKPIGGILKYCGNSSTPFCNNGFCSPVPSSECA